MYVEILSYYDIETVTLNLNNVQAIKLRKSRACSSLHPDYFSAIEYHYCNITYYELFKSDDLAFNRYNEIKHILCGGKYNCNIVYDLDNFVLPMDASHENEPFRDYLRLFSHKEINELDKSIESYNQQILNGNIKEEETINEWLDNFIEARKKQEKPSRKKK